MADHIYDAIVVGSGITGGWAAKELTEKGLETLVLEAGGPVDPAKDYVEHVAPWEVKFRGMGDIRKLHSDQFVQRECYACDEWASKFFVNDRENPYTTDANKPFLWIRGRQVGGRSIIWGPIAQLNGRFSEPTRFCSRSRPSMNASGRGGQPGTYTSTGMKVSTPCTTL